MRTTFLILLLFFSASRPVMAGDFQEWLAGFKVEAAADGISAETIKLAFARTKPIELVLKLDRNQPEFKLSLAAYLERMISDTRVRKGRENLKRHNRLLQTVAGRYGVQPRFLVALWGVETDFGRVTGSFPVIQALATLAYDPRRSNFFRKELLASLHILDSGFLTLAELQGSWAGAFGGLQFLPSVFRRYAVDFNGDNRIDIFKDHGDLFASGANYLARSGWRYDQTWGRQVRLPAGFCREDIGLAVKKTIPQWQSLGVRRQNGMDLPGRDLPAAIIIPDQGDQRAFMVYNNFEVLLKWNRSFYYAVAVGLLSDRLRGL